MSDAAQQLPPTQIEQKTYRITWTIETADADGEVITNSEGGLNWGRTMISHGGEGLRRDAHSIATNLRDSASAMLAQGGFRAAEGTEAHADSQRAAQAYRDDHDALVTDIETALGLGHERFANRVRARLDECNCGPELYGRRPLPEGREVAEARRGLYLDLKQHTELQARVEKLFYGERFR